MKLIKFEQISREEIENEAFDVTTNNGRALLLQDLLKSAENISSGLSSDESIIFLKEKAGGAVKYEVVDLKAS